MPRTALVAAAAAAAVVAAVASLAQPVGVTPVTRPLEVAPAIRVTSPDVHSGVRVGFETTVQWTNRGRVPDRLSISLHAGEGCRGAGTTLASLVANTGSAVVRIPATARPGDYSVRVGNFGSVLFGCSVRFHLNDAMYIVTEPPYMRRWIAGGTAPVRWRVPPVPQPVDIVLLPEHSTSGRCLARGTADDGEQTVSVPADVPPGWYRVAVCPGGCSPSPAWVWGGFSDPIRVEAR